MSSHLFRMTGLCRDFSQISHYHHTTATIAAAARKAIKKESPIKDRIRNMEEIPMKVGAGKGFNEGGQVSSRGSSNVL